MKRHPACLIAEPRRDNFQRDRGGSPLVFNPISAKLAEAAGFGRSTLAAARWDT